MEILCPHCSPPDAPYPFVFAKWWGFKWLEDGRGQLDYFHCATCEGMIEKTLADITYYAPGKALPSMTTLHDEAPTFAVGDVVCHIRQANWPGRVVEVRRSGGPEPAWEYVVDWQAICLSTQGGITLGTYDSEFLRRNKD